MGLAGFDGATSHWCCGAVLLWGLERRMTGCRGTSGHEHVKIVLAGSRCFWQLPVAAFWGVFFCSLFLVVRWRLWQVQSPADSALP